MLGVLQSLFSWATFRVAALAGLAATRPVSASICIRLARSRSLGGAVGAYSSHRGWLASANHCRHYSQRWGDMSRGQWRAAAVSRETSGFPAGQPVPLLVR